MKLQSRLAEAQGTVETLNGKAVLLEKEKMLLINKIEETGAEVDVAGQRCSQVWLSDIQFSRDTVLMAFYSADGEEVQEFRTHCGGMAVQD